MLKLIEKLMDKHFLSNKHFLDYMNYRCDRNTHLLIDKKFLQNAFTTYHNTLFSLSDQLSSIDEVLTDYKFSDIRNTDIVLDIGANIGAFTLFTAKKAKHVYAVEPLYTDILRKNISKNNLKNVTILETGIGTGKQTISYRQRSKKINLTSISDILNECGNVDFLKCDCEGCEWSLTPQNIRNIRRIEIEVHTFKNKPPIDHFEKLLKIANFNFETIRRTSETYIIHAEVK